MLKRVDTRRDLKRPLVENIPRGESRQRGMWHQSVFTYHDAMTMQGNKCHDRDQSRTRGPTSYILEDFK